MDENVNPKNQKKLKAARAAIEKVLKDHNIAGFGAQHVDQGFEPDPSRLNPGTQ